jgi:hypothetical protein
MKKIAAILIMAFIVLGIDKNSPPYTFSPQTPAKASEVNTNFDSLDSKVDQVIDTVNRIRTNTAVDTFQSDSAMINELAFDSAFGDTLFSTALKGTRGTFSNIAAFTLDGKLTAGANEIEGSNFDINGGDISSATVSGGITWSAGQDFNTQLIEGSNFLLSQAYIETLNADVGNITISVDVAERAEISGAVMTDTVMAMTSGGLRLEDDGGNLGVFVKDGGNIGAGDSDPAQKLVVYTESINDGMSIGNSDADYLHLHNYQRTNAGTSFGISKDGMQTLVAVPNTIFTIGTNNAKDMVFGTDDTERARITSGGAFSIGDSLYVGGNLVIEGTCLLEDSIVVNGSAKITGPIRTSESTLTISSGVITMSATTSYDILVETEGSISLDTLTSLSGGTYYTGQVVYLSPASTDQVYVEDNANINLDDDKGDFLMDNIYDVLVLKPRANSSTFVEVSRSNNQ